MPRAHLDEGSDQFTNRAALLSAGQEHCQRLSFHVLVSLATPKQGRQRWKTRVTETGGLNAKEEAAAMGLRAGFILLGFLEAGLSE